MPQGLTPPARQPTGTTRSRGRAGAGQAAPHAARWWHPRANSSTGVSAVASPSSPTHRDVLQHLRRLLCRLEQPGRTLLQPCPHAVGQPHHLCRSRRRPQARGKAAGACSLVGVQQQGQLLEAAPHLQAHTARKIWKGRQVEVPSTSLGGGGALAGRVFPCRAPQQPLSSAYQPTAQHSPHHIPPPACIAAAGPAAGSGGTRAPSWLRHRPQTQRSQRLRAAAVPRPAPAQVIP